MPVSRISSLSALIGDSAVGCQAFGASVKAFLYENLPGPESMASDGVLIIRLVGLRRSLASVILAGECAAVREVEHSRQKVCYLRPGSGIVCSGTSGAMSFGSSGTKAEPGPGLA